MEVDKSSKTSSKSNVRRDDLLPLLIIPGIMSSGLEIRKSAVGDNHIGSRVWLNAIALGGGKIQVQNAGLFKDDSDSETSVSEEQKNLECNSAWLQHMTLTTDLCTEREGNEIRPIPGLDGVDFLTDIAKINIGASYVFGPIIKLLTGIGYTKQLNLDACPYDWRIPPSVLERRDGYFTKTMEKIEKMYNQNKNKPVVLLCHSMGGKAGHYLLNFALEKLGDSAGREWIDKHVHTYMPLGAPHIGIPAIVATTFSGGLHPILDSMLSLPERLVFSRSLGSGVWLMPEILPCITRSALPAIFCKREGRLTVTILATNDNPLGDVRSLVSNKHGTRSVSNIKVKVTYGDKKTDETHSKVRSNEGIPVVKEDEPDAQYFAFPCPKFIFPTPASLLDDGEITLKPMRFSIFERGTIRAHEIEPQNKFIETMRFLDLRGNRARRLWNAFAKKSGMYKMNIGVSLPVKDIDVRELVAAGEQGLTIDVPIIARTDMTLHGMVPFPMKKHRSIDMKVNIKWDPPPSNDGDDFTNPIAMIPKDISSQESRDVSSSSSSPFFAPIPEVQSTKADEENIKFSPLSGQAMFKAEGLEDSFVALARDEYSPRKDRVDPRGRSSCERPPIKRIYAIYGTNLDTCVSTICKRVPQYHEDESPEELLTRPRFEIDTETRLQSGSNSGHKLKDGIIYEHSSTTQIDLLTGERISRSGDGSVPYYCLQQPQVWANELRKNPQAIAAGDTIKIEELEGAEHRAILSDERFHTLLADYLTGKTVL